MTTYLLGPILAFVPARWRSGRFSHLAINWNVATFLSGMIEAVAAMVLLVVWYSKFVTRAGTAIGAAFGQYAGLMGLLSFWAHPLTWVIGYFGMEGAARMLSGLATGEPLGTLPLALLDRAMLRARTERWSATPRLIVDEVARGERGWDLTIASCRPKQHWKYPLTLRYEGEFFQVQGEEHSLATMQRPNVYLLKRLPANEIIRGLEEYDPESVLTESSAPGFFATVLGELRKKWANGVQSRKRATDRR